MVMRHETVICLFKTKVDYAKFIFLIIFRERSFIEFKKEKNLNGRIINI